MHSLTELQNTWGKTDTTVKTNKQTHKCPIFNTPLSIIYKLKELEYEQPFYIKQVDRKISEDLENLNSTIKQLDLTDIYKRLPPNSKKKISIAH